MKRLFVYLLLLAAALLIIWPCFAQKPDTSTFQRRIVARLPDGKRVKGVFAFDDSTAWIKTDTLPGDKYRVVRYDSAAGILETRSRSATVLFYLAKGVVYVFIIPDDKRRYRATVARLCY